VKPSEILFDLGRPVAFYPGLRKITGSATATILLCQFLYWVGKQANKDGWLYKTVFEIENETSLSYEEQRTARKKLVNAGLLVEKYRKIDHEMWYRVEIDVLDELWSALRNPRDGESPSREMGNDHVANKGIPMSLISNTENTTETTTENNLSAVAETQYEPFNNEADLPQSFVDEYKPKKFSDPRFGHVAYSAFYSVTNRKPNKAIVDLIIEIIGDSPDMPMLKKCYTEWIARGYNPQAYKWLEWYRDGIPDPIKKKNEPRGWVPGADSKYHDIINR